MLGQSLEPANVSVTWALRLVVVTVGFKVTMVLSRISSCP